MLYQQPRDFSASAQAPKCMEQPGNQGKPFAVDGGPATPGQRACVVMRNAVFPTSKT